MFRKAAKKILLFALGAAASFLWSGAIPASADDTLIPFEEGDFLVTTKYVDQYEYDSDERILKIKQGATCTIAMNRVTTTTQDTIMIVPYSCGTYATESGSTTITLDNVSIANSSRAPLEVSESCGQKITIKLKGTNTLKSTWETTGNDEEGFAGLQKGSTGCNFIITSASGDGSTDGTLTATGTGYSAGIGGGQGSAHFCGYGSNITIAGGTVRATGGDSGGAGIGGAYNYYYSNINITGGDVTATADGGLGAGIGGGGEQHGSNINISGGTVRATGGIGGAGIGGGNGGNGSNITISGGTVTAIGGDGGAGIGGGVGGNGSNIAITGGTVKATGGTGVNSAFGAGVGGGSEGGTGSDISVGADSQNIYVRYASGEYYQLYKGKNDITGKASAAQYFESYAYAGALDITGDSSGYSYDSSDKLLTISGGGEYNIAMVDEGTTTTTDAIKVTSSKDVTITLDGVSIESASRSPLEIDAEGKVTINLKDTNTLKSTYSSDEGMTGYAGLQKTSTANTLTITSDDTDGTLTATGGAYGAGIGCGGGVGGNGCNIEITGGTVTANGGAYGAGIGGGGNCSGSYIAINGGTVTAGGGERGAGIGGGSGALGSGYNITINGGTVTATGGLYAAGIGGGYYNDGRNITINGGTVTATSGTNAAGIGGGQNGSGSNITIAGGTVKATGDIAAIGAGGGNNGSSSDIYIAPVYQKLNARFKSDGAYTLYGASTDVTDLAAASTYFDCCKYTTGEFVITGGVGYSYSGNILTVSGGGEYNIAMSTEDATAITDTIKVTSSEDVTITLDSVSIENASRSPFEINAAGNVTIKLKGINTLISTYVCSTSTDLPDAVDEGYPGLQKTSTGNTLTITSASGDGSDDGTLTATGTDYSAGIGGGHNASGCNITISGGTVTATASYGAGIGGGQFGGGNHITITGGNVTATAGYGAGIGGGTTGGSGENIEITGGTVTATSSEAAGIGGGYNGGKGSYITITGGTVTATGGTYGAGIGGGYGDGSNITISGGTVTATGGTYGAGIGGGISASGNYITITGGTVNATGSDTGAGIGGGHNASGCNITISGGTVTAKASYGAGIGGGYLRSGENIKISGGTVTATSSKGAGIGNSYKHKSDSSNIYISPAEGKSVLARYSSGGSYTVYSAEQDITTAVSTAYFDSYEAEMKCKLEQVAFGGSIDGGSIDGGVLTYGDDTFYGYRATLSNYGAGIIIGSFVKKGGTAVTTKLGGDTSIAGGSTVLLYIISNAEIDTEQSSITTE